MSRSQTILFSFFMQFSNLKRYLRFRPFEVTTQVGRVAERHRQILLTTISSGGSKILAAGISFLMIPLTLDYLGTERFGLWMTISSTVAMLSFADLGIGSGLMNATATAHGKDDIQAIRKKISAGLLLLGVIAFVIILLFFIFEPIIPWEKLFNIDSKLAAEVAAPTIAVVVVWFAISMPAGVAIKVLMGLQRGFAANIWMATSSIASLICVLGVVHFKGGLPSLAAATIAPSIVAGIIAGLYLFFKQCTYLRPQFSNISFDDVKDLAGTSGLFFLLQICCLIAFQSDYLIVAHYLGPESVAIYAVAFKLFTIPSTILSLFLNALWPAYAEAKSRGDKVWIYKSFIRSLKLSAAIGIPISIAILVCAPWIIENWTGKQLYPTWDLLFGLFFWSLLTILGGNFASLMNGLGIIKFQVVASFLMAIANIIISIFLVQTIGVSGAIWGSVISLTLVLYLPSIIFLRKYFTRSSDL